MKINFEADNREINITCKGLHNESRANKDDLGSFLNELAVVYDEAARYNESLGCFATAKAFKRKAHEFHEICDKLGMYDNL